MLEVRNVFLYYDGVCAVNDMSLDVAEGEIVGLIGTNGAGKTSLFNVITGFVPASKGSVGFLGRDVTRLGAARIAKSGMLRTFQTPVGFPKMTVMENMLVFSRADALARPSIFRGSSPASAVLDEAMEFLDIFGLASKASEWVQDLAAPELKMLEFARAMMAHPKMLLLDEPAAGVNPALQGDLVQHIGALRRRGVTFLVVDHNLRFIRDICDRSYAMADGRLIASGDTADVLNNPDVIRLYLGGKAGEEAA
ncbi:ABC transporter ATP-binding protein [Pseudogemmobacter sonorensis]|uniref:ABC transporter ATP-binding protein n=1 Tax=Pseudogemmobacter sonorensis TaxID=2989681 RepID=UPI00369CE6AD